jgi:TetR/AcrR family transcriptional repressor of nem operon
MRYVKGHGQKTRSRIVEEASYGLCQCGADGLSVADLMKRAGLTHGGFYAHFTSREDLVIEAFSLAMHRTITRWLDLMKGMPLEERFEAVVEAYLTSDHRDDPAKGCVLPALGADIARSSRKARRIFAGKLGEMIDMLAPLFPDQTAEEARQTATSALATMMGSVVLARAAGDKQLSDDILASGRWALRRRSAAKSGAAPINTCDRENRDHD